MSDRPSLDQRKDAVRQQLPIAAVVEQHVKLSGRAGGKQRRGPCPFHGGKSASFAIWADSEQGYCFGCQWRGDVIGFVRDIMGLGFMDALAECERLAGISHGASTSHGTNGAGPISRERNPAVRRARESVEPIDMARWIWRHAARDDAAARSYFMGRGVPRAVLTEARMAPFRFLADCPCWPWREGEDPLAAKGMFRAPALMAMVQVPFVYEGAVAFDPVGLHVTYLDPTGEGTMQRRAPWAGSDDADPLLPKRRMLGPVGRGAVLLGEYHPDAHLFVGEGNETVLSGMALTDAGPGAVGVATLSLDNLQGRPKLWKGGIWPLHAIEPDAERPAFTIPGHRGPVTGLIDSDMKDLRGVRGTNGGGFVGEKVVERRRGPIVQRAITGAERARICGELVVKGWRAIGAGPVDALRAPLGMDFNDQARELADA
jgi:DNA primase